MRVAIIHHLMSCELALLACLDDIKGKQVDKIITLGGVFGFFNPHSVIDLLHSNTTVLFSEGDRFQCDPIIGQLGSIYMVGRKKEKRSFHTLVSSGERFQIIDGTLYASDKLYFSEKATITIGSDEKHGLRASNIKHRICFGNSYSQQSIIIRSEFLEHEEIIEASTSEEIELQLLDSTNSKFFQINGGFAFDIHNLGVSKYCIIDNNQTVSFETTNYDLIELKKKVESDDFTRPDEKDRILRYFPLEPV